MVPLIWPIIWTVVNNVRFNLCFNTIRIYCFSRRAKVWHRIYFGGIWYDRTRIFSFTRLYPSRLYPCSHEEIKTRMYCIGQPGSWSGWSGLAAILGWLATQHRCWMFAHAWVWFVCSSDLAVPTWQPVRDTWGVWNLRRGYLRMLLWWQWNHARITYLNVSVVFLQHGKLCGTLRPI